MISILGIAVVVAVDVVVVVVANAITAVALKLYLLPSCFICFHFPQFVLENEKKSFRTNVMKIFNP